MKPQVLIVVSGGVVTDVIATQDVDVVVKDWDNIKVGDEFTGEPSPPDEIVSPDTFQERVMDEVTLAPQQE